MLRVFACLAALAVAGCAEDSSLPEPSGKGTIRAINAIPASPPVNFRIEERSLESLPYKSGSGGVRYDDFEYNFNFDAPLGATSVATRVASLPLKVDANRDYTLVLTGDIAAPDIAVWEAEERDFADGATVFQLRFAHLAPSLGEIDVYFDEDGVAPASGAAIATLAYGETLEPIDIESSQNTVTITPAGDPGNVLYQTLPITYGARIAYLLALFDGDESDVAPLALRSFTAETALGSLPDVRFAPTVRFIHAATTMPAADIYDEEDLTTPLVANQAFGDIGDDQPIVLGETGVTYTAAGNSSVVFFEGVVNAVAGAHNNYVVLDDPEDDSKAARNYVPDRRSLSTAAKLSVLHAASHREVLNFYVVDAGHPITELLPRFALAYGGLSSTLTMPAGDFELYATPTDSKTPVAGPVPFTIAVGDVLEVLLLDAVDPDAAEFRLVPSP